LVELDWGALLGWVEAQGYAAAAHGPMIITWLQYPVVRTLGLIVLVFLTIRAMGAIYGGDIQNADYGPVAIRTHTNAGLRRQDVRAPKALIPMSLDGVHAACEVCYTYNDWKGKRRRVRVARLPRAVINVVPSALPAVQTMVDGQEVRGKIGELHPVDVVIPTPEVDSPIETVAATPERVADYIRDHKVLETWTDDDNAVRISVHADIWRDIVAAREAFIVEGAERLRRDREGGWWARQRAKRNARKRPGVIGSYYLRFRHSRNPLFILTRHPDRDLKMTAWLTLLTSLFAMVMEAWPLRTAPTVDETARSGLHGSERAAAPVRRP
jgi:hypothetical protein